MVECLVTGIAPTSDAAQLDELLAKCQCDRQRLSVITKTGTHGKGHEHSGSPSFSSASTIMTSAGGTSVPGLGGSTASLSAFGHGGATDYLGGLPFIPADEAGNYNVAIAEGRSLVTYKAGAEEAANVEAAFRNAGLRKVKTFKVTS